jgi:uncharacterized protein YkwD
VRTGLLGASAAVAVGAIAVSSGMLPGGDSYSIGGGDGSDQVRSLDTPSDLQTQGGSDGPAGGPTHPDASRSKGTSSERPSPPGSPGTAGPSGQTRPERHSPRTTRPATPKSTAPRTSSPSPSTRESTSPRSTESAAALQVLALVNKERSTSGCSALRSDDALADLAGAFSEQMADEGFFDHTDPAGLSPWDRAAQAGVTNLGGENIARGQADAAAVMESWMKSPGHRANILNCDYTSIGIGVHFGAGGPWWTQDFGF